MIIIELNFLFFIKKSVELTFLINELKKQLVGPGMSNYEYFSNEENDDKDEILSKSPKTIYTAGILFPQGEKNSEIAKEEENKLSKFYLGIGGGVAFRGGDVNFNNYYNTGINIIKLNYRGT